MRSRVTATASSCGSTTDAPSTSSIPAHASSRRASPCACTSATPAYSSCNPRGETNMQPVLKRRRTFIAAATIAALAALTIGAVYHQPLSAQNKPAAPQAMPVPVATIAESSVSLWDEFSGRLEAVERVDVRSRVAGAVHSVHFVEGALVKRGDLLITIDPAPYAADEERAQAQAVAAQARVAYTKSEHERAQRLWSESAIAQRELDERTNARQEAEANLRAAQAALQSARLNLSYTQVRA